VLSANPSDLEDLEDEIPELVENKEADDNSDGEDENADGELQGLDNPKDKHDELQELDESDRMDVLAKMAIVRETVTKASHWFPLTHLVSHTHPFSSGFPALQALICHHSLHDNCSSSLVPCLQGKQAQDQVDAL
jgi:hypothetical protein